MTNRTARPSKLELWGGVECTIARVGDRYRDETAETGHADRPGDIDRIAALGIGTVRYPILWESVAPEWPDACDFGWHDERLGLLRERGITVVGGLLHHGSGPSYTDLLDPHFPAKFADFAARAAERYPWIETWTPVNEPLTTARFAGLYGHWYPHRRDYPSFLRALVNECLATDLAMAAIRAAIPGARLLQTEDLGKTFSTDPLRYQADHENGRRWLSFDLLAGRVDEAHPWHRILRDNATSEADLEALASGRARPDLIGINHYLTSERFLDHRADLYPGHDDAGNGRDRYVDAEAVRVHDLRLDTGIGPRLREAWDRYGIPMVVSEVHHGCTRDEQLRWFAELWKTSGALRGEGMDLRAVTLWSLFGNVDWHSLLTRDEGVYGVGAFDARAPEPRPTVLAAAAKAYAKGDAFEHPLLDAPGWWRRPERLYPWNSQCRTPECGAARRLLITGSTGTLGKALARICEHRGLAYSLTSRAELDIVDKLSVEAAIARYRPWAVVNAAGFVRVSDAERERDACLAANAAGPANLAKACDRAGVPLVTFSSDLVFDGKLGRPYREADRVSPAGVYGLSKAEAERRVLSSSGRALVIRTSAFFGPWDQYNFAWNVLAALARGEPVRASRTSLVSPTYIPDLCHAALDLLIDGEVGVWHLANQGEMSWHAFARRIAEGAGYDAGLVLPIDSGPPLNNALATTRGMLLRPVDHAIDAYLRELGELMPYAPVVDVAAE